MQELHKSFFPRVKHHERLLAICMMILVSNANAFWLTPQARAQNKLTVAEVLANVRKATGHGKLKKLTRGFVVDEVEFAKGAETKVSRTVMFGPGGKFREEAKPSNNRPFGFDGKYGWQIDRSGFPAPMPQRLREKLLIPAWVRSGWWLNEAAPFVIAILPEETNDTRARVGGRESFY